MNPLLPQRRALFCVVALVCAGLAWRAPAAPEALDWGRCLKLANRANPELRAVRDSLKAADYRERGSYAGFFPQLSSSVGFQRSYFANVDSPGSIGGGFTSSITASQNLFSGLADRARVDQAKARRSAIQAELDSVAARVSFELKSAFAGLEYAEKALLLNQEIEGRRERNSKLVQLRFETGHENKGSVLVAQSHLEQSRLDSVQAQYTIEITQAELARVLGLEKSGELSVAGAVPESPPPGSPALSELARIAPEYRKAIARENEADADFVLARSPLFPSLNLTGTAGSGGRVFFPNESANWSVGVALVFPLFNGGADYYATQSASEMKKAAALSRENSLRGQSVKLRQTLAAFSIAVRQLELDRQFLQASAVRSRIGREKYNNGLLTFEDWDLIENDYIQRQKALLKSARDRVVAGAAWEQAQGKGVFSGHSAGL